MDWKAIVTAFIGILAPYLFDTLIGWSADFPLDAATFTQLVQWMVGLLINGLGVGATGAALYRLNLQRKIKKAAGQYVRVGKTNVVRG